MNRFENRTVIVTGAGAGIGRAACLRLAGEGALVICMDIAESRDETARLATTHGAASGGSGAAAHLDITDPEGAKRAMAAVIGLTRHLAREFGPSGINVNAVAPGVILTPRIRAQMSPAQEAGTIAATPLGRIGTAEDVAGVVAFLASDDARHVTGVTIDVNGGYFLA